MKRALIVKMMYPVGCLLAFRGDLWLADLSDSHGIVLGHDDTDAGEHAFQVLVNERVIDILCDEFEDEELELIEC